MKIQDGMVEVFLTFHDEDEATFLMDTANRWAKCKDAYPSIIQVPKENYEIKRRVLADKLAQTDIYILADLFCVPGQPEFIESITDRMNDTVGMAGLAVMGGDSEVNYPIGLRVCRKGVVEKWPKQVTEDYNKEHAEAVRSKGKRVEIWPDIIFMCMKKKEDA